MKRFIATLAVAASAFVTGMGLAAPASAEGVSAPLTCTDAPEYMPAGACGLPGDDNSDGVIDEDESGWICEVMGNRICGPKA